MSYGASHLHLHHRFPMQHFQVHPAASEVAAAAAAGDRPPWMDHRAAVKLAWAFARAGLADKQVGGDGVRRCDPLHATSMGFGRRGLGVDAVYISRWYGMGWGSRNANAGLRKRGCSGHAGEVGGAWRVWPTRRWGSREGRCRWLGYTGVGFGRDVAAVRHMWQCMQLHGRWRQTTTC